MSDFKAKMHQNQFQLGLRSQTPSWNKGDLLSKEGEWCRKGEG